MPPKVENWEKELIKFESLNPKITQAEYAASLKPPVTETWLSTKFSEIRKAKVKSKLTKILDKALSNTSYSLDDESLDNAFRSKLNLDAIKVTGQLLGMGSTEKQTVNTTINLGVALFASEDKEKIKTMFEGSVIDDNSTTD